MQRQRSEARELKAPPDVLVSDLRPAQGGTVGVLVAVPPPRDPLEALRRFGLRACHRLLRRRFVDVRLDGRPVPCFRRQSSPGPPGRRRRGGRPAREVWRSHLAFTPRDAPGARRLEVEVRDGRHARLEVALDVREGAWPVERLWLPPSKAALTAAPPERRRTAAWRALRTPAQHWTGPFVAPAASEVTAGYGLQRVYNGVYAEGYYHKGVDYAGPTGAPVRAPQDGVVALAGAERAGFPLHGNCLGLDHGHGVGSLFLHLDAVAVAEGARVKRGEVIGTIGNTGISTGPHLHWGLYVNGACVDPAAWMEPERGPGAAWSL